MLNKPIITIEGATATGKTDFAICLAKHIGSQIISADSRQIYKYLDIGTAKPTKSQLKEIKHHLLNIVEPNEIYNAGRFVIDANRIIAEQNIPIVSGGTGFYVSALIEGLSPIPPIPRTFRKKVELINNPFELLKQKDRFSADSIHPKDKQRTIRALEVVLFFGKSIREFWRSEPPKKRLKPFKILLTEKRDILYKRIEQRFDKMLDSGLLSEIEDLLTRGYKWTDAGLNTLGYKEFKGYFFGEKSSEESIGEAKKNTRRFCKRQLTWYRKKEYDLTLNSQHISMSSLMCRIDKYLRK